jgi:hypothetical protein
MKQAKTSEDGFVRIGVAVKQHVHDRYSQIVTMFPDTSKSFWVEALCTVMSFKELNEFHDRLLAAHKLEEALQRKLSIEMLSMVRGKPASDIVQIAKAAENAVTYGNPEE